MATKKAIVNLNRGEEQLSSKALLAIAGECLANRKSKASIKARLKVTVCRERKAIRHHGASKQRRAHLGNGVALEESGGGQQISWRRWRRRGEW
jgi:hypothetical protein